jgi:hypothetical protein
MPLGIPLSLDASAQLNHMIKKITRPQNLSTGHSSSPAHSMRRVRPAQQVPEIENWQLKILDLRLQAWRV